LAWKNVSEIKLVITWRWQ